MRALITGGSGYLGRHIAQQLISAGWEVINFDVLKPPVTFHPEKDEWVEGDITDTSLLTTCLQCYPVDLVIHAALVRDLPVGGSKKLEEAVSLNIEGTRSLLWAMASVGCERLIALTGARAYGFCPQPYIVEEAQLIPEGKIGESLKSAEEMMVEFRQGLPGRLALLRVFEVYGYQGELVQKAFATPERDFLLEHLSRWKGSEASLLFGKDFTTRDGTFVRDFMHVRDLTRVVLEASKFLELESELICNLGLGKGYSQLDLLKMLETSSGLSAKVSVKDRRPEEAPRLVSNTEYLFAWCGEEFLDFPAGVRELARSFGFKARVEAAGVVANAAMEGAGPDASEVQLEVVGPDKLVQGKAPPSESVNASKKAPLKSPDEDEEDSTWSVMEDVSGPSDSVLKAVAAASESLSLFGDGP